jgi:hypothetical protein
VATKNPHPLAGLLNSKADLQTVTATIHDLVAISFITHPVAHRTEAEIRRRGGVLIEWFRVMRKDKGFSQSRTLAMLPYALKAELSGEKWEPPTEKLYRVG